MVLGGASAAGGRGPEARRPGGPEARAELAWAAAVLAVDAGDDTATLAARQRLAPLLAGIKDRFLHAAYLPAMA